METNTEQSIENPSTIVNPVLQPSHVEESKQIFKEAMEQASEAHPETVETPEGEKPIKVADPIEKPVESKPATKKGAIPEELLSGKESESPEPTKIDEAIAALDAMQLPENSKPKQLSHFGELKEQAKKVINEKMARIAELESKREAGASKIELESERTRRTELETKVKDLEETLARTAFEKSPKFQRQFVDSEKNAVEGAKAYLEGSDVNPNIIDLAMHNSGPKRLDILRDAGLTSEAISVISPYLADYDKIQRDKSLALENWQQESASWQQEQQKKEEQTKSQKATEEDRVWNEALQEIISTDLAYRKVNGNDSWNEQTEGLKLRGKTMFNGEGTDLKELAQTIALGLASPVKDQIISTLREQLNAAKAGEAKLKAARPDGGLSSGATKTGQDESKMTDEERRKADFTKYMAAAASQGV